MELSLECILVTILCLSWHETVFSKPTLPPLNCTADYNFWCKLIDDGRMKEYLANLTTEAQDYNEKLPPPYVYHLPDTKHKNATTRINPWVKLMLEPLFITEMSMKQMEFGCYFNVYLIWEDGRFRKPDSTPFTVVPDVIDIPERINRYKNYPGGKLQFKFWLPTIKFINCKGKNSTLSKPEVDISSLQITFEPWLQRMSVKYKFSLGFFCSFTFTQYPFDVQRCAIILSYAHANPIVDWIVDVLLQNIEQVGLPPEYRFLSITVHANSTCPKKQTSEKVLTECAEFEFVFQRLYSQHMMLLFIPSMLIVSLTWISFWLDETAAPPRVALGLTSLLTLATQFNNAQKDLPAVADIKAIDIWMFTCMIMVFLSLVEFAVANYSHRSQKKAAPVEKLPEPKQSKLPIPRYRYSVPEKSRMNQGFSSCSTLEFGAQWRLNTMKCCPVVNRNRIDAWSRIIFPMTFLIFNIVFWTYYLT